MLIISLKFEKSNYNLLYEKMSKLPVMHVFSIFVSKHPALLAISYIFVISEMTTHAYPGAHDH
jgi:hypothetical protein